MRVLLACLAFAASFASTHAGPITSLAFDGARYEKAFESKQQVEPFVEYTLPGETVNGWTKLLTLRWYRNSPLRPDQAAQRLAARAEARDGNANARISVNQATSEALVHFMAFETGTDNVEVDVFKYGLAADGHGLVAVQFAFRFTLGETDADDVKAARQRAVAAIRTFDLAQVRALFQPPAGSASPASLPPHAPH